MSKNILLKLSVIGLGILFLSKIAKSKPTYQTLVLAGTYRGYGNIYSPEIDTVNNRIYFSGWYNDTDYPDDAIRVANLDDITNTRNLIQLPPHQVGDPSIVDNKMFMTYSPDRDDLTQHKIALSTTNDNGFTWSTPTYVIEHGWMPSAIKTDKLYIYYTYPPYPADIYPKVNETLRAELNSSNVVVNTTSVTFDTPNFYPINIDVKYYDGIYYLLGDYWKLVDSIATYCIGMWTSINGIDFIAYAKNPVVIPSGDNIIARTPYFIKEGNTLKIWYAQQKQDWWTNAIFYTEYLL